MPSVNTSWANLKKHKNDQKKFTISVRDVVGLLTGKLCVDKHSLEVINSFFTNVGPTMNSKLLANSNPDHFINQKCPWMILY